MTRQECNKLLMAMMAIYSSHYQRPEESLRIMSSGWFLVLEDYSYEEASLGLKWFARGDKRGFPPAPGQIIDCIAKAREASTPGATMDEGEAWSLVYRAIQDSNYHSEERFSRLPPVIQRAVGSPAVLRQMAAEENLSVTRGQFARSYQQALARAKEEHAMPPEVKKLSEKAIQEIEDKHQTASVPIVAWIDLGDGKRSELEHTSTGWEGWKRGTSISS